MASIRVSLAASPRAEVHQLEGSMITLGSGPLADLMLPHSSIQPVHARLLLRRGRLLLVGTASGARAVRVGTRPVYAPVVLGEGASFGLGDLELSATLAQPLFLPMAGRTVLGQALEVERPTDGGIRRFSLVGSEAELIVSVEPARRLEAWLSAQQRPADTGRRFAPLAAIGEVEGHAAMIEALPASVRLARAFEEAEAGHLSIPLPSRLHILGELLAAVGLHHERIGAHGAVDPEHVALATDGTVLLLRSGPEPRAARRTLAPERRRGGRPSKAADVWSLGRIAADLWHDAEGLADLKKRMLRLSRAEPERRPLDLLALSEEVHAASVRLGLDPSTGHTARLARLLYAPPRAFGRARASKLDAESSPLY
ncbi:MAG: serine/threonine-protein kinase [Myxococcota bacterium]